MDGLYGRQSTVGLLYVKRLKGIIAFLWWETHFRAVEHHLRYGITQRYLFPDTGERVPPQPQPDKPTGTRSAYPQGRKVESTWVGGYIPVLVRYHLLTVVLWIVPHLCGGSYWIKHEILSLLFLLFLWRRVVAY